MLILSKLNIEKLIPVLLRLNISVTHLTLHLDDALNPRLNDNQN